MCRFDVNVTPDKRKVFLHSEKAMLQAFQQVHTGCPCTAHPATPRAPLGLLRLLSPLVRKCWKQLDELA